MPIAPVHGKVKTGLLSVRGQPMHCPEEREWEGKDSRVFLTPYFALGHIVFSQDTQPGVTCTTLNPEGLLGKTLQRAGWRECLFGIWSQTQQGNRVSTQAHEACFLEKPEQSLKLWQED